jgi:UDP-N-acetyl-D-glucosamine dehydrogenase
MPHYVVDKVGEALNSQSRSVRGSSVLVLGVSYKRDIDDLRESPALDILAALHQKGAAVSFHDPYVDMLRARDWPGGFDLTSTPLTPERLAALDCVVIVTDHRVFDYDALVRQARLIVDSRNAIKSAHAHVFRLGAP